ncbi:MAG: hypothetical protein JJT96_16060 [Opitutales bacterium]|nr:hypothetical protein [Opitutales bacterium]
MDDALFFEAFDGHTAFGGAETTLDRLLRGESALAATPVVPEGQAEAVPLAAATPLALTTPPRWWPLLSDLVADIPGEGWGTRGRPVFLAGSNFGIDRLYEMGRGSAPDAQADSWATVHGIVRHLRDRFGWGPLIQPVSHACVSAQVALSLAAEWMEAGAAEKALVLSFDYIGPFVSAGFHSLKILNAGFPGPYEDRAIGSIGLGDGAAWAVLSRKPSPWRLVARSSWNEMHHFTANEAGGSGFRAVLEPLSPHLGGRPLWIKGHGTGTLEAGRLEATAVAARFPGAPLVSWKGGLGHTLGSCALVELVLAARGHERGRLPGTVGTRGPTFTPEVATEPFAPPARSDILLLCNAFGGAHGALLLRHEN